MRLRYIFSLFICVLALLPAKGQHKIKALFLGNSYTGVNNLPQLIATVAQSMGDTLLFESNTPGGYTLQGHSTNSSSLAGIMQGNKDYVVLQEQSQLPSFPPAQVESEVFPYAHFLDSLIHVYNPCSKTVFYMTWGRKNGDASNCSSWPPVCTYQGMDSLLSRSYRIMADSNRALLSPVGAVWKYLRNNYPAIELYQTDESHPSAAGSYAAACCFYALLFQKNPSLIPYTHFLNTNDATAIRTAARVVVFDSLAKWNAGIYNPRSSFSIQLLAGLQVQFQNNSSNAVSRQWYFGDGDSSTELNPKHTYQAAGSYTVKLISMRCGVYDTAIQTVNPLVASEKPTGQVATPKLYPNPANTELYITPFTGTSVPFVVFSYTGKLLKSGTLAPNHTAIDITDLPNGLYLLQLKAEGITSRHTFIIQK